MFNDWGQDTVYYEYVSFVDRASLHRCNPQNFLVVKGRGENLFPTIKSEPKKLFCRFFHLELNMGIVFTVRAKAWRENPSLRLNEPFLLQWVKTQLIGIVWNVKQIRHTQTLLKMLLSRIVLSFFYLHYSEKM